MFNILYTSGILRVLQVHSSFTSSICQLRVTHPCVMHSRAHVLFMHPCANHFRCSWYSRYTPAPASPPFRCTLSVQHLVEIPSFPGSVSWAASLEGSPICSRPSPTEILHFTKSYNGAVKWLVAHVWILLSGGVTTGQVCHQCGYPV